MVVVLASMLTLASLAIDPVPDEPPMPEAVSWDSARVEPEAPPVPTYVSPYAYLYATYPRLARRMDCVIQRESGWLPWARNPRSGASGLAQFLRSTWLSTPQGKAGLSVFDPYANIDGAAWLATHVGWRQWQVVTLGYC